MPNSNSKNKPTPNCFSTIIQHLICSRNLSINPSSQDKKIPKNPNKINPFPPPIITKNDPTSSQTNYRQFQAQARARDGANPGIIARLMGLESLPNHIDISKLTSNDSLFRSKSLNSLHFLPDFDPTRPPSLHRRARTSSSFHEQGSNFLVKTEENFKSNGQKMKEFEKGSNGDLKQGKENRVKAASLKGNERRKIRRNESGWSKNNGMPKRKLVNNRNNKGRNVTVGGSSDSRKRRVDDHKEDALSLSPVSVLDPRHEFDSPYPKADSRKSTSSPRRNSSKNIKFNHDMPPQDVMTKSKGSNDHGSKRSIQNEDKLTKAEAEVELAEYFVDLMGQICSLTEEHIWGSKWIKKYEAFKLHCIEDLSVYFGQEMVDLLLDELVDELIVSFEF